ncbi:MAG: hypothetical protein DMG13_01240 [Acidobacteria bacterium]|nr:MAG: hypothetical protein DMG13_01240 [Acidobacteriota bacterium]
MIRHIVLFNLKPEIEAADREWLFGQMRDLAKIPSVRRLAIGKLLDPRQAWYKERIATDYGWTLSMEFDDEDGLYTYQTDPAHVRTAQEIRKRVSNIKIVDFVSV